MKTKDGTYRCEKCGREWHVLVNLDPDDECGDLVTAVKRLQKRAREGKVLP